MSWLLRKADEPPACTCSPQEQSSWKNTKKYPNLIVIECQKCLKSWEINDPRNPDKVLY